MAITKIHPIKSTLKKALDYITNQAKTDDKLLVSSYGCGIETADIEFEKTRRLAMNKGNNLAHHLIQAFEPGEVSYEKAHEIGRRLAEWDAQRKGTSYKAKLEVAIDRLIPISADLDDLLRRLEAEGYAIKRGKYISFRAPGQERFTRAKTLGEAYTEEAISERIKGKVILKTPKPERSGVSLLIDIENSIKAQQSAGYECWAKIENLKRAARTMVFLDKNGIAKYADLEQKITELQDAGEKTTAALKDAERRLSDLALLIKNMETYKELRPLYSEYGKLKKRLREYDAVKQNIDSILRPTREQEQDKSL